VEEEGVCYRLDPWPAEHVLRDTLEYSSRLVRAAQAERQRAERRERSRRWAWALHPLIGLLPEGRQLMVCDRWGLDPRTATLAGALLECVACVCVLGALGRAAVLAGPILLLPVAAMLRALGAVAFGEVAGSWLLLLAEPLWPGEGTARFDRTVLPLTREAFWARLAMPDRFQVEAEGAIVVRALLPHLSWGTAHALLVGEDRWSAVALPAAIEKGRLIHWYRLMPCLDPHAPAGTPLSSPPSPRLYQEEVREAVEREWDSIFLAAPWLPCLLPQEVQQRAFASRGGVAVARAWTIRTAVFVLLAGVWMVLGRTPATVATAALLLGEAVYRLWRCQRGEYAGSLLGWLVADLLRPERVAYQAHLSAERQALRNLA
jgi:hypothetical protein